VGSAFGTERAARSAARAEASARRSAAGRTEPSRASRTARSESPAASRRRAPAGVSRRSDDRRSSGVREALDVAACLESVDDLARPSDGDREVRGDVADPAGVAPGDHAEELEERERDVVVRPHPILRGAPQGDLDPDQVVEELLDVHTEEPFSAGYIRARAANR
jgi:hypothetical protein